MNKWTDIKDGLPTRAGIYLVFNNMIHARRLEIDDYHSQVERMYFSLKHKKFVTNSIVMAWQPSIEVEPFRIIEVCKKCNSTFYREPNSNETICHNCR